MRLEGLSLKSIFRKTYHSFNAAFSNTLSDWISSNILYFQCNSTDVASPIIWNYLWQFQDFLANWAMAGAIWGFFWKGQKVSSPVKISDWLYCMNVISNIFHATIDLVRTLEIGHMNLTKTMKRRYLNKSSTFIRESTNWYGTPEYRQLDVIYDQMLTSAEINVSNKPIIHSYDNQGRPVSMLIIPTLEDLKSVIWSRRSCK